MWAQVWYSLFKQTAKSPQLAAIPGAGFLNLFITSGIIWVMTIKNGSFMFMNDDLMIY